MIHAVKGDAARCGPCALSSLSGLPSSVWEDRLMGFDEFQLVAAECGATRLPHLDPAIDRTLNAFAKRSLPEFADGRYTGDWLLLLGDGSGLGCEIHAAAVSVASSPYRRWIVDNRNRVPASFSSMRRHAGSPEPWHIGAAWRWPAP